MANEILVTPKQLFEREDVRQKFESILGKNSKSFIVSVINCINNNPLLQKADQQSILFAAANAAVLGLPIDPNLGLAYIIPYAGKAQFQMGYKGFMQLALRSGQLKTMGASPIYEGQIISENPLTGFEFDFTNKDSKKVVGYAFYYKLMNGFEKTSYMTKEELEMHGKKYSKTFAFGSWKDNFDAMALKTIIKLTLSKYAPLSTEMQRAIATDQSVIKDWEGNSLEYLDNPSVKVDGKALAASKEDARIRSFIISCKNAKELEDNLSEYVEKLDKDNEIKKLYNEKLDELKLKD